MVAGRVVALHQFGVLAIEELDLPDPAPHQATVEIFAAAIQHAQLQMVLTPPGVSVIPGLEAVGRVIATGADVSRVSVDDIVIISPAAVRSVDRSPECATVEFEDGAELTGEPVFTWTTDAVVDEQFLVPVPGRLADPEAAAIVGDTARRAIAAVTRGACVQSGQSVAVFGVGGAGLCAIVAARAAGAGIIVAVGSGDARLELAAQLGATHTVNQDAQDAPARIFELCPDGVDHLIDCPYELPAAARPGRAALRAGGTAQLVATAGTPERQAELDGWGREFGYDPAPADDVETDIGRALAWIADGTLDPTRITPQRYTIEQINEAVLALEEGRIDGQALLVIEPLA